MNRLTYKYKTMFNQSETRSVDESLKRKGDSSIEAYSAPLKKAKTEDSNPIHPSPTKKILFSPSKLHILRLPGMHVKRGLFVDNEEIIVKSTPQNTYWYELIGGACAKALVAVLYPNNNVIVGKTSACISSREDAHAYTGSQVVRGAENLYDYFVGKDVDLQRRDTFKINKSARGYSMRNLQDDLQRQLIDLCVDRVGIFSDDDIHSMNFIITPQSIGMVDFERFGIFRSHSAQSHFNKIVWAITFHQKCTVDHTLLGVIHESIKIKLANKGELIKGLHHAINTTIDMLDQDPATIAQFPRRQAQLHSHYKIEDFESKNRYYPFRWSAQDFSSAAGLRKDLVSLITTNFAFLEKIEPLLRNPAYITSYLQCYNAKLAEMESSVARQDEAARIKKMMEEASVLDDNLHLPNESDKAMPGVIGIGL